MDSFDLLVDKSGCSVKCMLRETYLCLLEVARLKGGSCDGGRQVLSKGIDVFGVFAGELFWTAALGYVTCTNQGRVEQQA